MEVIDLTDVDETATSAEHSTPRRIPGIPDISERKQRDSAVPDGTERTNASERHDVPVIDDLEMDEALALSESNYGSDFYLSSAESELADFSSEGRDENPQEVVPPVEQNVVLPHDSLFCEDYDTDTYSSRPHSGASIGEGEQPEERRESNPFEVVIYTSTIESSPSISINDESESTVPGDSFAEQQDFVSCIDGQRAEKLEIEKDQTLPTELEGSSTNTGFTHRFTLRATQGDSQVSINDEFAVIYTSSLATLTQWIDNLPMHGTLGFDTEGDGCMTQLCSLCTKEIMIWVMPLHAAPNQQAACSVALSRVLGSADRLKVGIAAFEDAIKLDLRYQVTVSSIFDLTFLANDLQISKKGVMSRRFDNERRNGVVIIHDEDHNVSLNMGLKGLFKDVFTSHFCDLESRDHYASPNFQAHGALKWITYPLRTQELLYAAKDALFGSLLYNAMISKFTESEQVGLQENARHELEKRRTRRLKKATTEGQAAALERQNFWKDRKKERDAKREEHRWSSGNKQREGDGKDKHKSKGRSWNKHQKPDHKSSQNRTRAEIVTAQKKVAEKKSKVALLGIAWHKDQLKRKAERAKQAAAEEKRQKAENKKREVETKRQETAEIKVRRAEERVRKVAERARLAEEKKRLAAESREQKKREKEQMQEQQQRVKRPRVKGEDDPSLARRATTGTGGRMMARPPGRDVALPIKYEQLD